MRYSRRWEVEVAFRNAKQALHVEDPQNGWGRRQHGSKRRGKRPGPQPYGNRGRQAAERTFPLAFVAYAAVVVWYFRHGKPSQDIRRAVAEAPWYSHKRGLSFEDMLAALRRELWASRFSQLDLLPGAHEKIRELFPRWLLAA